jgi:hypothetical protein
MYFEYNRDLPINEKWRAEFIFRYEVKMSINGWGLRIHGPLGITINDFEGFLTFGDCDQTRNSTNEYLLSLITISDCGRFLTVNSPYHSKKYDLDIYVARAYIETQEIVEKWKKAQLVKVIQTNCAVGIAAIMSAFFFNLLVLENVTGFFKTVLLFYGFTRSVCFIHTSTISLFRLSRSQFVPSM